MATAINDFIQGMVMLVGIVAVIAAVLNSKGGLMAAMEGLASVSDPEVSSIQGVFNSFLGPDPLNLLFVVILNLNIALDPISRAAKYLIRGWIF